MSESEARLVLPLGGFYARGLPVAELLLRVTVGGLLVPHGAAKLFGGGVTGTAGMLGGLGFQPATLWAVGLIGLEFAGGIMLALGLLTRPVAAAVVVFMAVAFFIHWPAWFWNAGGAEMPLLWGVAALYFAIRGGGRYSLDNLIGRAF